MTGIIAISTVGVVSAFAATSLGKPPKDASQTNRITRDDLGISFVIPNEFTEKKAEYEGIRPGLVLEGPTTNQATTVVSTAHYTLNAYVGTAISLIQFPRDRTPDFDELAPKEAAKSLLAYLDKLFGSSRTSLNYQNSALIDISSHPALAVLAEASIPGLNDRRMVRFVVVNHRNKQDLFFFESNDTEFENRVPAFDAFLHSLKFTQPNVIPTPDPKKPINIRIGS